MFANFSRVFRDFSAFSQVFLDLIEPVLVRSNTLGHLWMHYDAFGCVCASPKMFLKPECLHAKCRKMVGPEGGISGEQPERQIHIGGFISFSFFSKLRTQCVSQSQSMWLRELDMFYKGSVLNIM